FPSHLAILLTETPPALVKEPPTYRLLPDTASAKTCVKPPLPPDTPAPSADHAFPFHLAMLFAGMPPALVKLPPAYRPLPDTVRARTQPLTPEPSADHAFPSHLAIPEAPPAYRLLPNITKARTNPGAEPRADQVFPSHFATPLAGIPPTFVKVPPTYKPDP